MKVSQHFLLSAQARTLSLAMVMRLTDDEAYETFRQIRWAANDTDALRASPANRIRGPPLLTHPNVAENGSYYGEISVNTGRPKTVHVRGYYRKDGTYVRGHYRSKPRR